MRSKSMKAGRATTGSCTTVWLYQLCVKRFPSLERRAPVALALFVRRRPLRKLASGPCRFRLAQFDVSLKPRNEEHVSTMSANAASLSASFRPADSATSAFSWTGYARIGLLTIGAAVLANAVFFYLAQVVVPYDPAFLPLGNVSAPIIFTVFPAVAAAVLYASLLQFVRKHAAMMFTVIAAITFVVTLIPDFSYIPTVDGVSNAEIAVLVVMHAIAAAVITRGLTSVRR
jgi:hypothetical protein